MTKRLKTVIANDFHGQYRDLKICKMFINFLRREQPDKIILNGDMTDFYSISRFDKDPARKLDLQDELDDVYNLLLSIRNAAPHAHIVYTEGNHEARLRKYLWSTAKALATLRSLKIEELLGLKELDITYEVDGVWLGKLFVYHGSLVRSKSGYTAHGELFKNGCSGVSGHTHRRGEASSKKRGGELVWYENSCMCRLDAEYIKGVADWSQGWGVVLSTRNRFHFEQVRVVNGKYYYLGKLYQR